MRDNSPLSKSSRTRNASRPQPSASFTKIYTIGVYGHTAHTFFKQLTDARIDVVIDVRRRRGVRGSAYAFANSLRLQSELARHGIGYVHAIALAPPADVLGLQHSLDSESGIAQRKREKLGAEFIRAYEHSCISHFNAKSFLAKTAPGAKRVCFLCVERLPQACHRSLIAARMARETGCEVTHLVPGA